MASYSYSIGLKELKIGQAASKFPILWILARSLMVLEHFYCVSIMYWHIKHLLQEPSGREVKDLKFYWTFLKYSEKKYIETGYIMTFLTSTYVSNKVNCVTKILCYKKLCYRNIFLLSFKVQHHVWMSYFIL